jgi:hypothetical protein
VVPDLVELTVALRLVVGRGGQSCRTVLADQNSWSPPLRRRGRA